MPPATSPEARNLVRALVGRELLVEAARVLGAAGVPLAPLKGVDLHARVYERPEDRPITDVDVLVPESRFGAARVALEAAGWTWVQAHASEAVASHPRFALSLDVHRRLFAPGAFALDTGAVFERATRDAATFGVDVWLLDPRDVLAHLVGHFVKSRAGVEDRVYLEDFERIGRAHAIDPRAAAAHLREAGMGRAARYAFGCAVVDAPGGFSAGVLRALGRDPTGACLAALARFVRGRVPRRSWAAALPGFLLEPSLARGAGTLWRRGRHHARAFSGATGL